jgi:site-specific recombinase XerD
LYNDTIEIKGVILMNEVLVTKTNDVITTMGKERLELKVYVNGMYSTTGSGDMIIEAYLATLGSKHTVRVYKRSILDFFQFLYPQQTLTAKMLVIDPVHAMAYREELARQLNAEIIKCATFNAKIKGCKQFYDWLMGQTTLNTKSTKLFNINPFEAVKQVAENDAEGSEPLSPEEVLLMIDKPAGESKHLQERNRLLLEIAISTGIRSDALLGIKIENIINIGGDWVINTKDKFNKETMKPINNYYTELMKWYEADLLTRGVQDNETIFNIHPHSANRIVKEWAKDCKIDKKITFHSLRTTTACQVYHIYDENLGRAKAVLQHFHTETTDKYLNKEKRINRDAEDIVVMMKKTSVSFEDIIKDMSREELADLFLSLDTTAKMQIMRKLGK